MVKDTTQNKTKSRRDGTASDGKCEMANVKRETGVVNRKSEEAGHCDPDSRLTFAISRLSSPDSPVKKFPQFVLVFVVPYKNRSLF